MYFRSVNGKTLKSFPTFPLALTRSFLSLPSRLSAGRVSHSAKVNIYGLPFIREMTKITGISGKDLTVKCPVAGYPIDKIQWERGECRAKLELELH